MPQSDEYLKIFYKLHPSLLLYVNQELKVIPQIKSIEELKSGDLKKIEQVRNALWNDSSIIDRFIQQNPFNFNDEELRVVLTWKRFVKGKFVVVKYLADSAVFLSEKNSNEAYLVQQLISPLQSICGKWLPVIVGTVLIPINKYIIYDGFLDSRPAFYSDVARKKMMQQFRDLEKQDKILKSLDSFYKQ